jgi:hypothetical protein
MIKKLDHDIGFFKKNAIFSAENWRKSQKIAIIALAPEL